MTPPGTSSRPDTEARPDADRRPDDGSPHSARSNDQASRGCGVPSPRAEMNPEGSTEFEHLVPLLAAYAGSAPTCGDRARLREKLVEGYLPLARRIAGRYANRGEPVDDLVQAATIGLIYAIDRFDLERGDKFLAFAVPTITGEVRRHFRDKTWAMRVPRRLKGLHLRINASAGELSQRLRRAPRPSEIAADLNVPVDAVIEGLTAAQAYTATSLERVLDPDAGDERASRAPGEVVGQLDANLELFVDSHAIAPYLAALPARQREILIMRFYYDMTQTQIGETIGVSQMHVSRLLSATLSRLREEVIADQPAGRPV